MTSSGHLLVGGQYEAETEMFVLKFDVLQTGKMGKRKDFSEFENGQIVIRASQKLHLLLGIQLACEHQKWTSKRWRKVARSDESGFLLRQTEGCVHMRRLSRDHRAPRCTMGRRQARWRQCDALGNVLLGNFGSCHQVDNTLTHTTYLSIVTNHVLPFMETVFPDGCGLFQQDYASCHKAMLVQEWFEEDKDCCLGL